MANNKPGVPKPLKSWGIDRLGNKGDSRKTATYYHREKNRGRDQTPVSRALSGSFDLADASVDSDDRASATTSPFTLNEVAPGTVITRNTSMGTQIAVDSAVTNLLANPDFGDALAEATPTDWSWGGNPDTHGRRFIRSSEFTGKNAVEIISGSQQPPIWQTVSGLTPSNWYTVGFYIEEYESIFSHLVLGVDAVGIGQSGDVVGGYKGWYHVSFQASAASHDIYLGFGAGAVNSGKMRFSMPYMIAGQDPDIYTEGVRSAQTLSLDVDGLIGEALSSSWEIMTVTWDYDFTDPSVSFTDGAGQTSYTMPEGISIVRVKEGGWTDKEKNILTAAAAGVGKAAGYVDPDYAREAIVEWGDSTTAPIYFSLSTVDTMQIRACNVSGKHEGQGGNTSAQALARQIDSGKDGYRPWITGINVGANDVGNSVPTATTMANIQAMVDHCGHNRFYICTPVRNVTWTPTHRQSHADLVSAINERWPNNVIDIYEQIGDDYKSDDIHLSNEGYQVVADIRLDFIISKGWVQNQHPVVGNPDADTWIARQDTRWTEINSGQRKSASYAAQEIEQILRRCGIWEGLDCFNMVAGSDLYTALIPIKGPDSINYNFVEGDYSETAGLTGDGSTKYLDTGIQVTGNQNYLLSVHGTDFPSTGGERVYLGIDERFSRSFFAIGAFGNLQRYAYNNGAWSSTFVSVGDNITITYVMTSSEDSNIIESYGNGQGPRTSVSGSMDSVHNITVFCKLFNGTPGSYSDQTQWAYAISNSAGLQAHRQRTYAQAMNLLARRLGRQTDMAEGS